MFRVAMALAAIGLFVIVLCGPSFGQQQGALVPESAAKFIGTVKTIAGKQLTLASDSGHEMAVLVQDSTRMLRAAPGQVDLKGATPIQLQDVQVGDRVLARGKSSETGLVASSIIVMKAEDIAQRHEQERADWQGRGIGGLVSSVDLGSGTVTISTLGAGGKKSVLTRTLKATVVRRYAPGSVKFDDAKPGTLDEIKPGDQLRARGKRSNNDTEFIAEEIVSGSFRNIAGTIESIDAGKNTMTVKDLATKKPVTVKVAADSQLKKLPTMLAQGLAMRLKGGAPPDAPGARTHEARSDAGPGEHRGWRSGGPVDLQTLLNRLPIAPFADLQRGEAVMMVTTQTTSNSEPTVITLLTGVEPILSAAPNGSGGLVLTPWSLNTAPAEGAVP